MDFQFIQIDQCKSKNLVTQIILSYFLHYSLAHIQITIHSFLKVPHLAQTLDLLKLVLDFEYKITLKFLMQKALPLPMSNTLNSNAFKSLLEYYCTLVFNAVFLMSEQLY